MCRYLSLKVISDGLSWESWLCVDTSQGDLWSQELSYTVIFRPVLIPSFQGDLSS